MSNLLQQYGIRVSFLCCFVFVILVHFSLAEFPDERKIGSIVGDKASLPCNITSHVVDIRDITMVMWYKDNTSQPVYTLDARQGDISKATIVLRGEFEERAHFDVHSNPVSLRISPVLLKDRGHYMCRVDFRSSRTFTQKSYLAAIEPADKPVIKDKFGDALPDVIGPYNEGEPLVLICETEHGDPKPRLRWWKESVLIDDTDRLLPNGGTRNELVISALQRSHLLKSLSCTASNNNLTAPPTSNVKIEMNFRPNSVKIMDKSVLSAHRTAFLHCISQGSRPPAQISWWKGNKQLKDAEQMVSDDDSMTTSILKMKPSSDDDGEFISCRAYNPKIKNSVMEDSFKLQISYPPEISIKLMKSEKTKEDTKLSYFKEGDDVKFICNIRAVPTVKWIGWSFNDQMLSKDYSSDVIISNNSLKLISVHRNSSGNYKCLASNVEGRGESDLIFLRVKHTPICKKGQRRRYGVAKHEPVKIHCEVEADPSDVTFRWWHNNTSSLQIDLTSTEFKTIGKKSVATFTPHSQSDYGELYCSASNDIGLQKEPCVFFLIPAGPPDPVKNCTISNQTSTSISLYCFHDRDGGLPPIFVVEAHDDYSHVLLTNVTSTSLSNDIIVDKLPPAASVLLVVYAVNSRGRSATVSILAQTLPDRAQVFASEATNAENSDEEFEYNQTETDGDENSIFIGVVLGTCLMVILTVVIIIILASKSRRRNIRSGERMTEDDIHQKKQVDDTSDAADHQGPDVLPTNISYITDNEPGRLSSIQYPGNRFEMLYESSLVPNESICPSTKMDCGVLYAELTLQAPSNVGASVQQQDKTQYAKLDFRKMNDSISPSNRSDERNFDANNEEETSCLAPLMPNRMESCV